MKTFWNLGTKFVETLRTLGEITTLLIGLAFEDEGVANKVAEKIAGRYDEFKSALKTAIFWIIASSIIITGAGVAFHSHVLLIIAATIIGLCASYVGIAFSVFSLVLGLIFEKGNTEKAAAWGKKILGAMFSFLVWEYIVLMFALIAPPWRNPAAAVLAAIAGIALGLMRGAWGGTGKNRHHDVLRGIAVFILIISMPAIWFPRTSKALSENTNAFDATFAQQIRKHGLVGGIVASLSGPEKPSHPTPQVAKEERQKRRDISKPPGFRLTGIMHDDYTIIPYKQGNVFSIGNKKTFGVKSNYVLYWDALDARGRVLDTFAAGQAYPIPDGTVLVHVRTPTKVSAWIKFEHLGN